ncbi:MAG TPA: DUF1697 domain-containing protein [Thermoanaerobaculia bacterium]|nr:DUF1697 domain-containing protein [Thermoanaerobaculia bacterium]
MAEIKIALLRGINVGKAKRVAMAGLRELVADLGYSDARTLLNSGNVVFRGTGSCETAAAIATGLVERFEISAAVTVITAEELARAVAENPLSDRADNPSRLLMAVLADAADVARLVPLAERDWNPEALALGSRVAYLWCPDGVIKSAVSKAVDKELGAAVTARNWNTMTKLLALAESLETS